MSLGETGLACQQGAIGRDSRGGVGRGGLSCGPKVVGEGVSLRPCRLGGQE